MAFAIAFSGLLPGCANLDTSKSFAAKWTMRGAGAMGAFVLHEVCHIAVGAAFGAKIDASFRHSNLYLEFGGLSPNQHQAVSIAGNACTGIAAELIVDTRAHKKSNAAWGAAAYHSVNAFGYAFSKHGDADYWKTSGGTTTSWQVINATHSSRIGAQLAWDSELGDYLKERWQMGPRPGPVLSPLPGDGGYRPTAKINLETDAETNTAVVATELPPVSSPNVEIFPASLAPAVAE